MIYTWRHRTIVNWTYMTAAQDEGEATEKLRQYLQRMAPTHAIQDWALDQASDEPSGTGPFDQ